MSEPMSEPSLRVDSTTRPVTAESAIHDIGYQRYRGTHLGPTGAWRSLFGQGFRAMFGLGRGAKAKIIPVFIVVVTVLPALAVLSAAALSQGVVPIRYGRIIEGQLIMLMLFIAAQSPEVLSRDQQHHVLPLILTRDVTRFSYATARFAAIVSALFLVAITPLLVLYIGEIAVAVDPTVAFARMGSRIWPVLGQSALTALAIGGIGAALAACTPRRAYATAAIIGVFIGAAAMASALNDVAGVSRQLVGLLDPIRSLTTQALLLFGEKNRRMDITPPLRLWWYALTTAAFGALGFAILHFRIRQVRA